MIRIRPTSHPAAWLIVASALVALCAGFAAPHTLAAPSTWDHLKQPGHFVLIRHALAPGTGDPQQVDLNDCGTQRNLSDGGRAQARRTGNALRAAGIASAYVFTSQWCRCRETAELLGLGPVQDMPALNSFFSAPETETAQMQQLREDIARLPLDRPTILITHQVVITSLTGIWPRSGELVVVRRLPDGQLRPVSRIDPLPTD